MANISKKNNNPRNVGIIMDGNGRWALKNSLKISQGHKQGVKIVRDIVEESVKQNIKSLTLYAFSSENWKRPKAEVTAIKNLVVEAINDQVPELKEKKVRLKFFGHLDDFGKKVLDKISYAENETACMSCKLDLNVALGYGGKQDIVDAVKNISLKVLSKEIKIKDIDEKTINKNSSVPIDDIDLLIRTGGDFTTDDYIKCLNKFKKVSRRFGRRV